MTIAKIICKIKWKRNWFILIKKCMEYAYGNMVSIIMIDMRSYHWILHFNSILKLGRSPILIIYTLWKLMFSFQENWLTIVLLQFYSSKITIIILMMDWS